jgi:hypothetical protein
LFLFVRRGLEERGGRRQLVCVAQNGFNEHAVRLLEMRGPGHSELRRSLANVGRAELQDVIRVPGARGLRKENQCPCNQAVPMRGTVAVVVENQLRPVSSCKQVDVVSAVKRTNQGGHSQPGRGRRARVEQQRAPLGSQPEGAAALTRSQVHVRFEATRGFSRGSL